MLYTMIVSVTMLITTTLSLIINFGKTSVAYAIFAPLAVALYVLVVLGVLALSMRLIIPKRVWNYKNKLFKVKKKEINRLVKIGIKKWKDKVPEMGWTAGFEKANIKSTEINYLSKFLQETCFAEGMHLTAGVLGFTVLALFPQSDLFFTLPIAIVNLFLHLLPCLIQRYTRFRLAHVYEFKLKHEKIEFCLMEETNATAKL